VYILLVETVDGVAALAHQIIENIPVEVPEMLLDGVGGRQLEIGTANIYQQFVVSRSHCMIPIS
jgi:hypothetical protein